MDEFTREQVDEFTSGQGYKSARIFVRMVLVLTCSVVFFELREEIFANLFARFLATIFFSVCYPDFEFREIICLI